MSILRISGISDKKGIQGEELRTQVASLFSAALHPYVPHPYLCQGQIASATTLRAWQHIARTMWRKTG